VLKLFENIAGVQFIFLNHDVYIKVTNRTGYYSIYNSLQKIANYSNTSTFL